MQLYTTIIEHIFPIFVIEFLLLVKCNVPYYNQPPVKLVVPNIHPSYRQNDPTSQVLSYGPSNPVNPTGQSSQGQDPGIPPGLSLGDPGFVPPTDRSRLHDKNYVPAAHGMMNITEAIKQPSKDSTLQEEIRSKSSMRDRIVNLIMSKYRSYERPPDGGNATIVTVNMKVLAIFSIDVRTMDYYIDLLLRQVWRDRRLSWHEIPEFRDFNEPLVSPKLKEQLWLPDLFFRNVKDNNEIFMSNASTNISYDSQRCHINIGSYGYTLNELKFVWNDEKPVELADKLQLSEFETPEKFDAHDCSSGYSTSTGQYTCLNATFELQRQLGSYLATTYVPNVLIIMVSWLSFWVNVDSAPARVPLGLLSLLGILTQAISVSSTLPRVSYIKAIDIWMIFSIIFVIGVLVEYAVALTLLRRKQSETWHEDVKDIVREELARWCAICQQQQLVQLQNSQGLTRVKWNFVKN
ncbi:unnamed protein product [Heterobilharzia americana]|nr:unnamed protein product [Heterobilharzia americana]